MKRWTKEELDILLQVAPNWELCKELLKDRSSKAIIKKYYEIKKVVKKTTEKEPFYKRFFKLFV